MKKILLTVTALFLFVFLWVNSGIVLEKLWIYQLLAGKPGVESTKGIFDKAQTEKAGGGAQSGAIIEKQGLVDITEIDYTFVIDLRYATDNNFTGKKIYPVAKCLLQKQTAQKLINANNELKEMGYRIKIWDAYRPFYVQQILWDAFPDKRFLADPNKGSHHNRGTAVDVTLTDMQGNEVEMPSGFDEFTPRANRGYMWGAKKAVENRELLTRVMEKHGFNKIQNEWWHFSDVDSKNFPLLNIKLEEF